MKLALYDSFSSFLSGTSLTHYWNLLCKKKQKIWVEWNASTFSYIQLNMGKFMKVSIDSYFDVWGKWNQHISVNRENLLNIANIGCNATKRKKNPIGKGSFISCQPNIDINISIIQMRVLVSCSLTLVTFISITRGNVFEGRELRRK